MKQTKRFVTLKKAADAGDKSAQTAKKLLDRGEYDKKRSRTFFGTQATSFIG